MENEIRSIMEVAPGRTAIQILIRRGGRMTILKGMIVVGIGLLIYKIAEAIVDTWTMLKKN